MTATISRASALPKWRLKRVIEYVDENIEGRLRLADLAAAAGLSPMYFAAQFRAATGCRPHDYVLACRIERAQALMSSTDLALAEIALIVGFHAQAHFTDVFKRIAGETPARWRQARRAKAVLRRDTHESTSAAARAYVASNGSAADALVSRTAIVPKLASQFGVTAMQAEARQNIGEVLRVIDDELSDGQTWITLSGPSVADLGLYFYLMNAKTVDADLISYPNVRDWLSRVFALFDSDF